MDFTKHTVPLYICAQSGNQNTYLHWYVSVGTFPQTSETVIVFVSHSIYFWQFQNKKWGRHSNQTLSHHSTVVQMSVFIIKSSCEVLTRLDFPACFYWCECRECRAILTQTLSAKVFSRLPSHAYEFNWHPILNL